MYPRLASLACRSFINSSHWLSTSSAQDILCFTAVAWHRALRLLHGRGIDTSSWTSVKIQGVVRKKIWQALAIETVVCQRELERLEDESTLASPGVRDYPLERFCAC
jgi:hypothetical protein